MSSETPDEHELIELEQTLGRLKPASHLIDSHSIVFEAGRQSVLIEQVSVAQLNLNPDSFRIPGRFNWKSSSNVATSIASALVGGAAIFLFLFSAGFLGPLNRPSNEIKTMAENRIEATLPEASAGSSNQLIPVPSASDLFNQFDEPGVLSATGNLVVSHYPVKANVGRNANEPRPGENPGSTYWRVLQSMRNGQSFCP